MLHRLDGNLIKKSKVGMSSFAIGRTFLTQPGLNLRRCSKYETISEQPSREQAPRFVEAARAPGAVDDETTFATNLVVIARQKPNGDVLKPRLEGK